MGTGTRTRGRAVRAVGGAVLALLLLAGCGDAGGQRPGGPPTPAGSAATDSGPERSPGPRTPRASSDPVTDGRLRRLTERQAAAYVSIPWQAEGAVTAGRPFTVSVEFGGCLRVEGVRFARRGGATEVAVLGSPPVPGAVCPAISLIGSFAVAWPADLPVAGPVVHAPVPRRR